MSTPEEREKRLLAAYSHGDFLDTVYKEALSLRSDSDELALHLASLHNKGTIDLVSAFSNLGNPSTQGPDFFLTRRVFEQALKHLEADTAAVMRCVWNLYSRAGHDLAAGTILDDFVEFCSRKASRPKEALHAIESAPGELDGMLTSVLVAGTRIDREYFIAETLRLAEHLHLAIRRNAIFAIALISWPDNYTFDGVLGVLEKCLYADDEDSISAVVLRAACAIAKKGGAFYAHAVDIISRSIDKGGDITRHSASQIISSSNNGLPLEAMNLLIHGLNSVNADNKGTIDNIDFGIYHMLKKGEADIAIDFLGRLLSSNPGTLTIDSFDSAKYEILKNNEALSKCMTRWFLTGNRALCHGVRQMIEGVHGEPVCIDADTDELKPVTSERIIFVARKAIGYLFMKPVTAASIVVSLLKLADKDAGVYLSQLLFDPLLKNYPGATQEFLRQAAKAAPRKSQMGITKALRALDAYLGELREMPDLAALHPPQAHREMYLRRMNAAMSESMKAAEKESVFLSLVSKSTLLYGRKSITYVYGAGVEPRRHEIPMTAHSVEMEFPRMDTLDPFELDYMLRVFRAERFKE